MASGANIVGISGPIGEINLDESKSGPIDRKSAFLALGFRPLVASNYFP